MVQNASNIIRTAVERWENVTVHPHRFGGIEFRYKTRELGHLHGDSLVDIPFPMSVRNELIERGRVQPHHHLPRSGWISFKLRTERDVDEAVALLRLSYEIVHTSRGHS